MAQLRYPAFLDTARVGPDGNLSGFRFRVFENPVGATEENFNPGPEVVDANPFCAIAHMQTALALAYIDGAWQPAAPTPIVAGASLGLSIPASDGITCNIVVVVVQPATPSETPL